MALVLLATTVSGAARADDSHLLAGIEHFRSGRFEPALVELKVSRQLGTRGDIDWYIAAALTKLHRVDEALEVFAAARASAPDAGDPLLDYYHAMACYEARLLLCADGLLARVEAAAGPRVASQARKVRADIAAVLRAEPPASAIDACLATGREAASAGRAALAAIYFREAGALAARRADGHGGRAAAALLETSPRGAVPPPGPPGKGQ